MFIAHIPLLSLLSQTAHLHCSAPQPLTMGSHSCLTCICENYTMTDHTDNSPHSSYIQYGISMIFNALLMYLVCYDQSNFSCALFYHHFYVQSMHIQIHTRIHEVHMKITAEGFVDLLYNR